MRQFEYREMSNFYFGGHVRNAWLVPFRKNWAKKLNIIQAIVLVLPALPDKELLPGQRLVILVEAVLAQVHPDNIQK